jgi:hypothetical protein
MARLTRWEHCWFSAGAPPAPSHIALAYLFEGDKLKALIEFRGTIQRHFYTIRRFEGRVGSQPTGRFPSIEEAKAAA